MDTVGGRLVPVLAQLVRLLRESDPSDPVDASAALSLATLSVLGRLVREGAQRLTDLARAERATQPGMSQLVDRLARDGLVRRRRHHSDGRVTLVEVTRTGRAAYDGELRRLAELLDSRLADVPEDDLRVVDAALPVLDALVRVPA